MPTRGVRRRWALDNHGIRREGSKDSGFSYRKGDGSKLTEEKTLARIAKLRIPPAWQEVRIARADSAPLQAVGVDKKGRTQYLYHSRFRQQREEAKFRHVVEFGDALPKLRSRIRTDLKRDDLSREQVLAAILRLMDQGFFRVGNDKSAKSESTYGLTTVLGKHVKVEGKEVHFDYVGKWRKKQSKVVKDVDVAKVVANLKKLNGGELFKYKNGSRLFDIKDRHVNDYIQEITGQDFTAKDFRTWAGTLLCFISLGRNGQGTSKTERKRKMRKAIVETAEKLGNTPAVCRSSYICPRLLDAYTGGKSFQSPRKSQTGSPVVRVGRSIEENALLKFFRETIADRRLRPRAA